MKNFMTLLLFICFVSSGRAQQMISMNELTHDGKAAPSLKVKLATSSSTFVIREDYVGQFRSNPVEFVKANFDIQRFIEENRVSDNDSYLINFSSKSGFVSIRYDEDGKVLFSRQEMKNVPIAPENLALALKEYQGWDVLKNKHVESHRRGKPVQNFYKVKITDGKKTKTLKFKKTDSATARIASKE